MRKGKEYSEQFCLHFLAEGSDVPASLYQSLATVMMLVKFNSKPFKHDCELAGRPRDDRLACVVAFSGHTETSKVGQWWPKNKILLTMAGLSRFLTE